MCSPKKHTFDIISVWLLCVQRWGANRVGKSKCDGVEIVQKFNGNESLKAFGGKTVGMVFLRRAQGTRIELGKYGKLVEN